MDEYKSLANKICIPSFFVLLITASTIHFVYSYLIYPLNEIIIPASLFAVSISLIIIYIKFISGSRILNLFVPLIISFIVFLRIVSFWNPILNNSEISASTVLVKSVKSLRYSNEIIADFEYNNTNTEFIKTKTAICYVEKGIDINPGDEISLETKPFIIATNKIEELSGFELNLLRKGISSIFYLHKDNFKIVNVKPAGIKYFIRNAISQNLEKLFSAQTVPVLKALYFGNKRYIDKTTLSDFKRAGVLHVLAASGLHTGIIAGAIFIFLVPFLINRKAVVIVISLALLFYLYITDMPVSLLRAFIMYSIFAIQYVFNLERNIFNTLFVAAIFILAINPYELYTAGFQLSFGATFGIIMFYKFYNQSFSSFPGPLAKTLSATLSAQIFVFPVIYMHMKEINLMGILSNMIIITAMSVTLVTSLVANMVSVVSLEFGKFVAFLTDGIYGISINIVKILSGFGGHFFVEGRDFLLLIPYVLFLFPLIPFKRIRKIMPIFIIASVIISWTILSDKYTEGGKAVAIMNNDQASVIIFNRPDKNIIYGELRSIQAAEIIVKYLNRNNIRNICLYIPVPDFRNLKSYLYLIKKSIVSDCCMSSDFMFTGYFKKFCKTLDQDNIKLKICSLSGHLQNREMFIGHNTLKEIFISPVKNIKKIPYLLSKNQLLIDNLIDNYEVEYIDN